VREKSTIFSVRVPERGFRSPRWCTAAPWCWCCEESSRHHKKEQSNPATLQPSLATLSVSKGRDTVAAQSARDCTHPPESCLGSSFNKSWRRFKSIQKQIQNTRSYWTCKSIAAKRSREPKAMSVWLCSITVPLRRWRGFTLRYSFWGGGG
jgi:hypothetical protein